MCKDFKEFSFCSGGAGFWRKSFFCVKLIGNLVESKASKTAFFGLCVNLFH